MPASDGSMTGDLARELRFETLLCSLVARFVNIAPAQVSGEIEGALRELCDSLGADRATLWWFDPVGDADGARLRYHYQVEEGPPLPVVLDSAALFPWTTARIRKGETVSFERIEDLPPEAVQDRESFLRFGSRSSVVLPLMAGGTVIGIITFATIHRSRRWASEDLTRLRLSAQIFADAFERERSDLALRTLSQRLIRAHEQERARLARELHDDLTQRLALMAIELSPLTEHADAHVAATTFSVRGGLRRMSEEVHALSYRLHPTVIDDLGLADAVRGECDRLMAAEPFGVRVTIDEPASAIPREHALCLFRVLQEALRNASRHAGATEVAVALRAQDGGLCLTVRDDGSGFDPRSREAHGHVGIASMRERLQLVDGELRIDSTRGEGTEVVAWVPLKAGEQ